MGRERGVNSASLVRRERRSPRRRGAKCTATHLKCAATKLECTSLCDARGGALDVEVLVLVYT